MACIGALLARSARCMALALASIACAAVTANADDRPAARIVDLPTRPGATVRILSFVPDRPPAAAAILLAGSDGIVGIPDRIDADWTEGGSALVRIAPHLRGRGVYVVVMDAPSDHPRGMTLAFRAGSDHMEDVAAVIADTRRRSGGVPTWLVAHSSGSASALNVAARLPPPRGPDGLVIAATIWRPIRTDGAEASPRFRDVRLPVLLVHNRQDGCTPLPLARELRALLVNAAPVELLTFDGGGAPATRRCARFAAHGSHGIEREVAAAIAAWTAGR